jgi:hypothetical protein
MYDVFTIIYQNIHPISPKHSVALSGRLFGGELITHRVAVG